MSQTYKYNINKHKTEDYKISSVKYYLKNKISMNKICKIFECKNSSLKLSKIE